MGRAECTPEPLQPMCTPRESNILSSDEIDAIEEITVGLAENEAWHQQRGGGQNNCLKCLQSID